MRKSRSDVIDDACKGLLGLYRQQKMDSTQIRDGLQNLATLTVDGPVDVAIDAKIALPLFGCAVGLQAVGVKMHAVQLATEALRVLEAEHDRAKTYLDSIGFPYMMGLGVRRNAT